MNEYDEECIDLPMLHGQAKKMVCLRPWTNEVYQDAASPFDLSATYKITYEDGAEVVIGGLPAYALAQGSFWYNSDSSKEYGIPDSIFARDTRVLAYLARVGEVLKRETEGSECELPSTVEIAEQILAEIDVPFEALKYGGKQAKKNADRWVETWKQNGLVEWDEENQAYRITH